MAAGPRNLPGERMELYSPIGLLPIDVFTGGAPIGRLSTFLDLLDKDGKWRATDTSAVKTPGGVITYPALGRNAIVSGGKRHYRVRIKADFYLPMFREQVDGVFDGEFDAFPYNDTNPPENYPKKPEGFPEYLKEVLLKLWLVPAPNYPFPPHVSVLRGNVVEKASLAPIIGAEVIWGNREKALSGDGGRFALPLRITEKAQLKDPQKIDATDPKTQLTGTINIIIPQAVGNNQTITIP